MTHLTNIDTLMIANNLVISDPTHPGAFLEEELEERGISILDLASELEVNEVILKNFIDGKTRFNIELAMMLEAALGIDADYWMNLQANYDRAKAQLNKSFMSRLAKISRIAAAL